MNIIQCQFLWLNRDENLHADVKEISKHVCKWWLVCMILSTYSYQEFLVMQNNIFTSLGGLWGTHILYFHPVTFHLVQIHWTIITSFIYRHSHWSMITKTRRRSTESYSDNVFKQRFYWEQIMAYSVLLSLINNFCCSVCSVSFLFCKRISIKQRVFRWYGPVFWNENRNNI